MTLAPVKAPWHLWLVGVVATLFNFIGVYDFTMAMAQGAKYLEGAGMTPAQIAFYMAMPGWATIVWAIGVFAAFIASILLLVRKRLSYPMFVVSIAAFAVHLFHAYVLTNGGAIMGQAMAVTSAIITVLLVFFAWYARMMTARAVLR